MADDNSNDSGLMGEFEEFLKQREDAKKQKDDDEDFDVEIWDEKGRGVRTKRSHAKPFLQSLGIDVDDEPETEPEKKKATPRKSTPPTSVTKKYFSNKRS